MQSHIQKLLHAKLKDVRLKNPSYSLRAFAKKIGLSAGTLSQILKGQRNASRKLLEKIGENLSLDRHEMSELLASVPLKRTRAPNQRSSMKRYVQINMSQFESISAWYYSAILSLCETADYRHEPAWVAKRLNITAAQAKTALRRLEELRILEKDVNGKIQHRQPNYITTDGIPNSAIQLHQTQILDLASKSLERDEVSKRFLTTTTISIDPEKISKAQKMMGAFRDQLCAFLESGDKKQVYAFCNLLIPLSRD